MADTIKFSQLGEISRAQMSGSDYAVGYKTNGDNKKWTFENQADFLLNDSEAGQEFQETFVKVQNTEPTDENNKIWIEETPENEVEVPTYDEFKDLSNLVSGVNEAVFNKLSATADQLSTYIPFTFSTFAGKRYIIKNESTAGGMLARIRQTRDGENGTYITNGTQAGQTDVYEASEDADYIAVMFGPTTTNPAFSIIQEGDVPSKVEDLKSAIDVIGEKVENLYDVNSIVIGKNWAGGNAENRAYIQIPVTAGKTYTIIIPTNEVIPQVAVVQLNSAPAPLGSFYITGGNKSTFAAVTNCVSIRIQFEGSTTLSASSFDDYDVRVFEGTDEYSSAIDKIARSKLPKEHKYIFIGDSYCEGYNPDGNVTGWGERLKTAMGLTNNNCIIKYKGGTGFYHVSDGKTFSTLLDEAGTGIDKTSITDIIVCGGWNDNSESLNNVYFNGVLAFATKVSNEYPNATLYVGMIGASNNADVKSRLQSVVLYSYQYGVLRLNYRYLNMVEYALSVSNLASDGIHPNVDGQVEITLAIKQALETGCAGLPYRFYNTLKTN